MAAKLFPARAKANKYRNRKTILDGIKFDSAKESKRYFELKILARNGEISNLELQPKFLLEVGGVKICDYVGDFQYERGGEVIIEDVKSEMTRKLPVYRLKKKLLFAILGIEIKET